MPRRRTKSIIKEGPSTSAEVEKQVVEKQTKIFKCRYCKVQFPSELNRNYHEKQRFCSLYSSQSETLENSNTLRSTSSEGKFLKSAPEIESIEIFKCSECKEYIDGKNEFSYHTDMKCTGGGGDFFFGNALEVWGRNLIFGNALERRWGNLLF